MKTWINAQEKEMEDAKNHYRGKIAKSETGLYLIIGQDNISRVFVPTHFRQEVARRCHEETAHGGWRRTFLFIKNKYIWPSMTTFLKRYVESYERCVLSKTKLNWAHGRFRATEYKQSRMAYGIDFYEIAKSRGGHVGVLTIVDMFSRFVMFEPVKAFSATEALRAIMKRIVGPRGMFKILVSDAAKAFLGKILDGFKTTMDIKHIVTFCYPKGNAVTERCHVLLALTPGV